MNKETIKLIRTVLGIVLSISSFICLLLLYICFIDTVDNDTKWFLTIFFSMVVVFAISHMADKVEKNN